MMVLWAEMPCASSSLARAISSSTRISRSPRAGPVRGNTVSGLSDRIVRSNLATSYEYGSSYLLLCRVPFSSTMSIVRASRSTTIRPRSARKMTGEAGFDVSAASTPSQPWPSLGTSRT
jgi:hypothetical protein